MPKLEQNAVALNNRNTTASASQIKNKQAKNKLKTQCRCKYPKQQKHRVFENVGKREKKAASEKSRMAKL